jgi:hypothetical protein
VRLGLRYFLSYYFMYPRLLVLLFFVSLTGSVFGQFTYTIDQSIPVKANNKTLRMPWAGGFNAAQFNTMDLNSDNKQDLVIFERSANIILTFLNQGDTTYVYAPEFETQFPPEVDQFLILRDFNRDGKKDIFTHNNLGLSVFVNTTPPGGPLQWRPYDSGNALLTTGFNGPINLQVNATDVSGIQDIDGDGDLDILDARFVGIGSLEYHKNMSMELTGTCDSLLMVRVTEKWGDFEECNCGQYLFVNDSICPVFAGRTTHAAGKSILAIDVDNDGDRDLFFSEETCSNIYFMKNLGNADSAYMDGFTYYPPSAPIVNFQIFPATYYEDVNFDGIPDLIVGSNIYDRSSISDNFQQSAWLYLNQGTVTLPNFAFIKNNFLQDQMIEVGDNSAPAFVDADGDGDLDMFIGSYTSQDTVSHLFYYENTGSASSPEFTYVTDDYNTISSLGFYNLKPQFADIDGNGTQDLVFTATSMQTGTTSLYFIPNKDPGHLDFSGATPVNTSFVINPDENVLLVDVNQDGLYDILLGTATGALQYWINHGPRGVLDYTLQNPSFLGLGVTTARQNPVITTGDLNADGKTDLVLGDQLGAITIYSDFRAENPATSVQNIIWDEASQSYISKNLGGRVWPTVVNVFATNRPAMLIGNFLGGMVILKNSAEAELPANPVITIFPNPTPQNKTFTIKSDRDVTAQVFTVLGVKASDEFQIPANQNYEVTPQGLPAGVYIARFRANNNKTFSQKFVIY